MDWFRLPLSRIVPNNLVVGFQKMAPGFLPAFCHMIEEQTTVRAKELPATEAITCGALHLGTGEEILPVRFLPGIPSIETGSGPGNHAWEDKIGGCLTELSRQTGPLAQCFLPFRCPRASPWDGAGAFAKRRSRDSAAGRDGNLCGLGRKRASGGGMRAGGYHVDRSGKSNGGVVKNDCCR